MTALYRFAALALTVCLLTLPTTGSTGAVMGTRAVVGNALYRCSPPRQVT